jgi:3-hydroxyisobutyrate dehydrogenase
MKTGFIGLGNLGKAMARRLADEGIELLVWNRTSKKASDLGVAIAKTPADVISECPVTFVNLFDSNAVHEVLAAEDGLLAGNCKDRLIVDTTTNHPQAVIGFHDMCADKQALYLEAPVLGSVMPAGKGELTILVSGDKATYGRAKLLLERLGQNIFYFTEYGMATRMKLINNLVLGTLMAGLAEAVALGETAGIPKDQVLEILGAGAGNSAVLTAKRQKLLDEDFAPHFAVGAILKDLHQLQDMAFNLQRPVMTGSVIKELYSQMAARGEADLDFSAIYNLFKPAK